MKHRNDVVATFNDLEKAQAAQHKLEQAGIHAEVVDESKLYRWAFWPFVTRPLACEKVEVEETDSDFARRFLEEADTHDHVLRGEVRCPTCGSPHVLFPQFFTRRFWMPNVVGMVSTLLPFVDKKFYCEDCHHTWPFRESVRSHKRHMIGDLMHSPS